MMLSESPEKVVNQKVALDELLQLKRAERPEGEFWARFESDLRSKQLAAIMARRPWWHFSWSRVSHGLVRLRVPIGATAVVALAFLTVREYRKLPISDVLSSTDVVSDSPVALTEAKEVPLPTMVESSTQVASAGLAIEPIVENEIPVVETPDTSSSRGNRVPWVGDAALVASTQEFEPSRGLASPLAMLPVAEPSLIETPLPAVTRTLASSFTVRSATSEPLARVSAPTSSRREWLHSLISSIDRNDAPRKSALDSGRERMTGRLNEDQLYNKFGRLGVAGGGLNVSF